MDKATYDSQIRFYKLEIVKCYYGLCRYVRDLSEISIGGEIFCTIYFANHTVIELTYKNLKVLD